MSHTHPHGATSKAQYEGITVEITTQHYRRRYPEVLRGLWLGAYALREHTAIIPVDYGSVEPYTIDDLAAYLWMGGGHASIVGSKTVHYQTETVTVNPFTGLYLKSPFALFTYEQRPPRVNRLLQHKSKHSVRWYGDVLIVKLQARNCLRPVSMSPGDSRLFVDISMHLMRTGRISQTERA